MKISVDQDEIKNPRKKCCRFKTLEDIPDLPVEYVLLLQPLSRKRKNIRNRIDNGCVKRCDWSISAPLLRFLDSLIINSNYYTPLNNFG